jgi:hypothetical protein
MLIFVETGTQFTSQFGDIDAPFYNSLSSVLHERAKSSLAMAFCHLNHPGSSLHAEGREGSGGVLLGGRGERQRMTSEREGPPHDWAIQYSPNFVVGGVSCQRTTRTPIGEALH